MVSGVMRFAQTEVWRIRLKELSGFKFVFWKSIRTLILSLREFTADKCAFRASALTFYTLLSIIPMFAMVFGIAKGFGLENTIEKQVMLQLKGQEEVARWIIKFAKSFLENTKGGLIAGIGVVVLFYTIIKVLNNIEDSFNAVWKTHHQRTMVRKISDYLSIMLIAPVFLIVASSLTLFISREVDTIVGQVSLLNRFGPFILSLLKFSPYVVTWILFSFVYIVMPNTKVNFTSGILGAVVAGTIFQIFQWAYISFQIGVSKYNAIYGSFAALPLFLVWLQMSWLILLFGAEISHAYQNAEIYEYEPDCSKISYSTRKLLMVSVVHLIARKFDREEHCCTADYISSSLDIPVLLLRDILGELIESGIVSETKPLSNNDGKAENSEVCYQPAFDICKMTISAVIDKWENHGFQEIEFAQSEEIKKVSEKVESLRKILERSPENVLLKDIQ